MNHDKSMSSEVIPVFNSLPPASMQGSFSLPGSRRRRRSWRVGISFRLTGIRAAACPYGFARSDRYRLLQYYLRCWFKVSKHEIWINMAQLVLLEESTSKTLRNSSTFSVFPECARDWMVFNHPRHGRYGWCGSNLVALRSDSESEGMDALHKKKHNVLEHRRYSRLWNK